MAYSLVLILAFGVYMGWFYWNRAKKIREAGGAAAFGQQLYRKQFGLAADENLKHYFNGEWYLGPLRPDVGPSTTDKVLGAVVGTTYRGSMAAFCLTDKDRCAIAIEWGDQTKLRDKVDAYKGEGLGMDPYAVFGSPKPVIRRGEEVFAGHPKYPSEREAPFRGAMSGRQERFVLIHIEPPGATPITMWIEPLGAKALIAWSQLSSQASYNPSHPHLSA